jgi:glucose-6-phosphate 1-dehydrogenase
MSKLTTPTILVIVGITGDLAHRKLLPAIREIALSDAMPEHFRIVGVSRRDIKIDDVLPSGGDNEYLRGAIEVKKMDLDNVKDYKKLDKHLEQIEKNFGEQTQRLFYLSIPPLASQPVIEMMGQSGLAKAPRTKLLLEKPFGTDQKSAEELVQHIHNNFEEDQVYRIDHYLAKEMTQNLVVFRSGNSLFKRTWNKDFIEAIDITAAQHIGIEGRTTFYEQTGALRDIIQSHLLQLAALTLMELPPLNLHETAFAPDSSSTQTTDSDDWQAIPAQRFKALQQLRLPGDVGEDTTRGQYRGYRREVDNQSSSVETFVSLTLESTDPNWAGVPITLTTGKALEHTYTEIRICYRREESGEANTLILRIQPNEGVELRLWAKQPGYDRKLRQLPLNFSYSEHFTELPEAYERVFIDAMRGDRSLFTSSEEVLESWRILKPVQDLWANGGDHDLVIYESGSSVADVMGTNNVNE